MSYDGSLKFDTKIDSTGFQSGVSKLKTLAKTSIKSVSGTVTSTVARGIEKITSAVTTSVTAVSTGAVAAATAAVKSGIEFESAFAGVKKTVNATDGEISSLRQDILDMSEKIPQSASDLAAIAEAAGQLGIKTENISEFTEVMANLGVATNMSSDEAATALARLANITGMPQTDFDKLGSTIVALGNNFATTESEITDMSLRLAGAGEQVGMSESEILSFSAALSSVGIEAEMGGSAFSTLISNMSLSVESGGDKLKQYAEVAGMSASEFKTAFKNDAASAISAFIKGLGNINKNGGSAISTLNEMGITETRMRDTLLRASSASGTFTEALKVGADAWKENTALTNEAEQRYETLESKIQLLKNGVTNLGIEIKDSMDTELRGAVDAGIGYVGELSAAFTEGGLQSAVETAGGIFGELATKAAESAPDMIDAALQFIDSFVNGIKENGSELLTAGQDIVQSVLDGIVSFAGYGSDFVDGAVAIINSLILEIAANGSELLKAGESIIDSIVNGIVSLSENAGTIVRGAVALVQSLIKSVKRNKDKLITAAKEIVGAITEGLVSLLPKEVQTPVRKCIDAITKLFNSDELKTAIEKVGRFIGELGEIIAEFAGEIIPVCVDIIGFLIDNFDTLAPLVIAAVTAIKAYREAALIANTAQAMLNGTMSANPIGAVITLVGTLVEGVILLAGWFGKTSDAEADLQDSQEELEQSQENYEESTDNLADSLEKCHDQMGTFQEGIDNAKSSLDGLESVSDEEKSRLETSMKDCQDKIDAVVKTASDERRKLTDNEIEELDKLIAKEKSIAEQQLQLELKSSETAKDLAQAFVTDYGLSGSADDFLEQSQEYIKGAEEAEEKVTNAAKETCNQQITYLKTLLGTSDKYNQAWYDNEVKTAYRARNDTIAEAKKKKSETVEIIESHYQQLNWSGEQYLKDNQSLNDKMTAAEKEYNDTLVENGKWYNEEYKKIDGNRWDAQQKYADLKAQYQTKQTNAQKEYTDTIAGYEDELSEVWNEETGKQIDSILTLAQKVTEGGETCSDSTARSVYETREALKNLPDDVKEKLGDTYDEWIDAFDDLPPEMYTQGKKASDQLRKATGKELSDDMSKNGKTAGKNFVDSASEEINKSKSELYNDGYELGENVMKGYINGLSSWQTSLEKRAEIIAETTPLTLSKKLNMNSPSKVMAKLGRYTGEGFIIGLQDKAKGVADMAKALAESVTDTMSGELTGEISPNIAFGTNSEMTARLKAAVNKQAAEIGMNTANRNTDVYSTAEADTGTIRASGNIETHINIDGREFAVATVPYIDEELAFNKR